jgi:MFS family permease
MLSKLLPTPTDFPPEQTHTLRKNISMNVFDGSFYVFGMSFIAIPTVVPIFIRELGGSTIAVGSVHVLWTLGLNIPAAFAAQRLKRKSLFKPQMVFWGFIHRLMLFISAVMTILIVGKTSPTVTVSVFLALLFLTAVCGSMSGVPWFQVFTKTVPVKLRGRMMGLRQLIGSAAGAFAGYLVGIIIHVVAFPLNFSLLYVLGFIMTMISFYYLLKIEEQPTEQIGQELIVSAHIIDDARRLLGTNVNFRNFLIADALILMSMSAVSFYSIYALEKFSLPPSFAGTFSVVVMITNIVANIVFGLSADHFGHRINIITVSICSAAAACFAIFSSNIFMYGFVFMFIAAAIQVHAISRMPFIAEISSEQERPLYVGIANTITAPSMLLGIVFGALIPQIGFAAVFTVTGLLALTAVVVVYRYVREPRFSKGTA